MAQETIDAIRQAETAASIEKEATKAEALWRGKAQAAQMKAEMTKSAPDEAETYGDEDAKIRASR